MPAYFQTRRTMRLRTPLGDDALLLVGLEGTESISELFHFRLDLLAPAYESVDFGELLGKPVSVVIETEQTEPRWLHGMAIEFSQGRQDEEFVHYELVMAPKLWWWAQRQRSRVFQQKTTPEILKEVLDGLDFRFEFSGDYPSRNYCVQYRETDYIFFRRLIEEEGMYFFFEFNEEVEKLVISDANVNLPEIAQPNPIIFDELDGGVRDEARILSWTKRQAVGPAKVTLWDHSFELPGQNLEADESIEENVQVGTIEHALHKADEQPEIYDYPGGYAKRFDGVAPGGADRSDDPPKVFEDSRRVAKLRMQEIASAAIDIRAKSNCPHLTPGHKFTLERHPHADGDYLIGRVQHSAKLEVGYRSDAEPAELEYRNEFTCHPYALPYRPRRSTPRPCIAGVQTATVVGPSDAEIFCDKYGRVKIQFHWDREGKKDADSSCWVRVAQIWAGNRWGAFFWPRIGHEVVVTFLEGDPDRPLIVGSVYNAANMPPPELPAEATVGGIKSCIFGGNPMLEYNAVMFHDTRGHEYVQTHSAMHELQHSEANQFRYVPYGQFAFHGHLL